MAVFNTLVGVVNLIEADTADAAVNELSRRLRAAGFEPHEEGNDAFESEPID